MSYKVIVSVVDTETSEESNQQQIGGDDLSYDEAVQLVEDVVQAEADGSI